LSFPESKVVYLPMRAANVGQNESGATVTAHG
jgi:hypothetical protein